MLKLLNLQPAKEEGELDGEEERVKQVELLLGVTEGKAHCILKKKKLGFQIVQQNHQFCLFTV